MYFRKPDIQVPYLYIDMAAAVLCASFMSFGVKRRWFALGAAVQLAFSTYASYISGHVYYGDWLKVHMKLEAYNTGGASNSQMYFKLVKGGHLILFPHGYL